MASRREVKVRTRTKTRTERKHDMKYSCFRRSGGDLTTLHNKALFFDDGAVNMLLKLLSSWIQLRLILLSWLIVQARGDLILKEISMLSPHASRYHFHLPYLFFRKMWHLLWKYISS
ncbi:hypothetical protein ACFX1S_025377 [Malus domestica]